MSSHDRITGETQQLNEEFADFMRHPFTIRVILHGADKALMIRQELVPRTKDLYERERLLGEAEAIDSITAIFKEALLSEIQHVRSRIQIQSARDGHIVEGVQSANALNAGVAGNGGSQQRGDSVSGQPNIPPYDYDPYK